MAFNAGMFGSGLGGLLGGLFGHSDKPYDAYDKWQQQAQNTQQPYQNAGTGALGNYQEWLNSQKDPTAFINKIMGNYQQSPYAKYLQQQSLNAGQNAASASGLTGSTPLFQQLEQNAGNISSQDMNQWLQNVLGINTQYGQGQQNLINGGQNAANSLTNIFNNRGEAAYGREAGKNQDFWNTIGGGIGLIGSFL